MLALDDVWISYGPIAAVRGLSMRVDDGEAVSVIGPNGAGKSTTLNAIAGMLRPSRGDIVLDGVSIVGTQSEQLVRRGVALVPEGRRIFGSLTVAENVAIGATIRTDKSEVARDIARVLARFPVLERYRNSHADRLSGGEQQQLAIARALLSRPRLLLLDEPSLGLAPAMVDMLFEVLGELKDDGVTILLVEQAAQRAIGFADRTYVFRGGKVTLSGKRSELLARDDLTSAYLGV